MDLKISSSNGALDKLLKKKKGNLRNDRSVEGWGLRYRSKRGLYQIVIHGVVLLALFYGASLF